jgi:hypothetical protein
MVVEHNWRSTWRRTLGEPRDPPLGGHCGETIELEGRKPAINIPPHLSQHPNGIHEIERSKLKEPRKEVGRYDMTRP